MAKFCSKCGRPLEEGEVCHCDDEGVNIQKEAGNSGGVNLQKTESDNENATSNQTTISNSQSQESYRNNQQNNNQQNNNQQNSSRQENNKQNENESEFSRKASEFIGEIKKVLKRIVPILKNPVKEVKNIIEENDRMGFYMIITHIIAVTLAAVIIEEGILSGVFYSSFFFYFDYSLVKFAIYVIVLVGAIDFILAALLLFTTKVLFNFETTYNKMMTIVGGMAIVNAVTVLTGALVTVIFESLGTLIILLGMAFSILVLIFNYSENVKIEADKKIYALLISFALLVIVILNLVYLVF